MNLTERLQRAKVEREIAAGTRHSSDALRPEPEAPTAAADDGGITFDPVSIEVGPIGLAPVADPISDDRPILYGTQRADSATAERCPNCNRFGRVDMVDLVGHRTHYTCDGCGAMWNVYDEQ